MKPVTSWAILDVTVSVLQLKTSVTTQGPSQLMELGRHQLFHRSKPLMSTPVAVEAIALALLVTLEIHVPRYSIAWSWQSSI